MKSREPIADTDLPGDAKQRTQVAQSSQVSTACFLQVSYQYDQLFLRHAVLIRSMAERRLHVIVVGLLLDNQILSPLFECPCESWLMDLRLEDRSVVYSPL